MHFSMDNVGGVCIQHQSITIFKIVINKTNNTNTRWVAKNETKQTQTEINKFLLLIVIPNLTFHGIKRRKKCCRQSRKFGFKQG